MRVNPLDFLNEDDYNTAVYEQAMGPSTLADIDRAEAYAAGQEEPEQCWILSDRDVWYRNPAYHGPVQPHPEDDPREVAQ